MTRAVVDASAFASMLLEEPDSDVAFEHWTRPDLQYVAPAIVLTEVPAAIERAVAASRVDPAMRIRRLRAWRYYRTHIAVRDVDGPFAVRAAGLPGTLRGMDRLYLQASLELGGVPLLSFDRRQREVADALGLPLLPAEV